MKPINEYTIQECLDRIYDMVGDGYDKKANPVPISELAWRIECLTRWIPVEERLPTLEDSSGFVDHDARTCATVLAVDKTSYSPRCVNFRNVTKESGYSHWRRIETSPPLTINDVKKAWVK
jgi:hypothetical protein